MSCDTLSLNGFWEFTLDSIFITSYLDTILWCQEKGVWIQNEFELGFYDIKGTCFFYDSNSVIHFDSTVIRDADTMLFSLEKVEDDSFYSKVSTNSPWVKMEKIN